MKKIQRKKTWKTRTGAILLAAALAAASLQGLTTLASGQSGNTRRQELYTVGNTSYEIGSSINKGNRHDCQHLGLWIPAGVTFRIRQVNLSFGQDMTFRLRNDDGNTEQTHTLKKDGSWLEVTPTVDSVPFIGSLYSEKGEKPLVEFTLEGTKELPVYTYGDDEEAFFRRWDELEAPFAVYLSKKYAIFLVPQRDKKANKVGSLDELLLWYDNMVAQYNAFSGLSEDAEEVWDRDSGTRYFIKANRNGAGAAYYSIVETAPNSDSLAGYMETGNWGPLHEVGHGYDTVNFGSAEIWNNVLSHYYQVATLGAGTWLHLDDGWRDKFVTDRDNAGGYFQSSNYDTKLYFWVNMLDKLGPQKTSAFAYQLYRKNKATGVENLAGHSFYADAYTRGSGYNVTPWFDLWGFTIEDTVRDALIQEQLYQNIYALNDLVSVENARLIQEALGLDSRYSMVETRQLVEYGRTHTPVTGTLTIQLDELALQQLQGKTLRITDGVNTVKTVTIAQAQETLTLDAGVYDILLPSPTEERVLLDRQVGYVVVTQDATTLYPVTAQQLGQAENELVDWTITFGSTYSYWGTYCTATTDLARGELRVNTVSCAPHTYIDLFSYIKVYDTDGTLVYEKNCSGKGTTAEDRTITIAPGYTIALYHAEPSRGLKVCSSVMGSVAPVDGASMGTSVKNTLFQVTEYGLAQLDPTSEQVLHTGEEHYAAVLTAYMESLRGKYHQTDFQNPVKFPVEKAKVILAVEKLPESRKEAFLRDFTGYYPFNAGVQALTIDPIPIQDYTGQKVEPALTVRAGQTVLTQDQYELRWDANTDVGTARVKVYGLGAYAQTCGEAYFQIQRSPSMPGSFTVTAEPGDEGFYLYSGGGKRPGAEVRLGQTLLVRGVDYQLFYENNVNVGQGTIRAVGMGNYAGLSGQGYFQILPRPRTLTVTVLTEKMREKGTPLVPEVEVYAGQWKLSGEDYVLSCENNVAVGTGQIHVTGQGNYLGSSGTGTFQITEALTPLPIEATALSNWTYQFSSWVSGRLSTLSVDLERGKLEIQHTHAQPHVNFGKSPYVSIAVYDRQGSLIYQKKYIGDQDNYGPVDEFSIGLGDRVVLYVAEPERNDTYVQATLFPDIRMRPRTGTYEVTDRGLREITEGQASTTDPYSRYPELLRAYLDSLKEQYSQEDFWDREKFRNEKAMFRMAVVQLTEEELQQLKRDYAGYYPFEKPSQGSTGGSVGGGLVPTPTPTPTPSPSASPEQDKPFFQDVAPEQYYYLPVQWAVKEGITTGLSEDRFAPQEVCLRAQLVTFLWRAAGSPTPEGEELSFRDVSPTAYYYQAVQWAVEQGITNGMTQTSFAPEETVTRAQMAAMLYRALGAGANGQEGTFQDVEADAYYANAVNWAAAEGITTGTVPGRYSPEEPCLRGQIVTMLYRAVTR